MDLDGRAPPDESLVPDFSYLDEGSGYDVGRREGDEALKASIAELRRYAFKEQDDPMLKAQAQNRRRRPDVKPVLLEIDAGPMRAQRVLDALIAAEQNEK